MIRHTIGMGFIYVGILFDFLGVLGLLRLPDVYNRLQAATKCVTFGSAGLLFGVFVLKGFTGFGFKVLLAIAFIFLTSPIAAHAAGSPSARKALSTSTKPTTSSKRRVAMMLPKLREIKEALTSFFSPPYTTKYPAGPAAAFPSYRGLPKYDKDNCVGCGTCAQVCPSLAIQVLRLLHPVRPVPGEVHHGQGHRQHERLFAVAGGRRRPRGVRTGR